MDFASLIVQAAGVVVHALAVYVAFRALKRK